MFDHDFDFISNFCLNNYNRPKRNGPKNKKKYDLENNYFLNPNSNLRLVIFSIYGPVRKSNSELENNCFPVNDFLNFTFLMAPFERRIFGAQMWRNFQLFFL